ncbi:MAG: hypothetical protein GX128_04540, partial [Bacteroidales bacterium]|nr:hypothetical protein [Bacteroidales bacterium]
MRKFKLILTLILVIGLYSFGFTQVIKPKVQATIKPNPVHPHCVDIFAKADKGVESEAIMGIVISISIPDQSPKANPTITNLYLIPGVEIDINSPAPYIYNGRYQMDFNIVYKSDYYQYWDAGQEYLIATFCFETEEEFCEVVRMQHWKNGGPNKWTYWYFWNYKQSDPMAGDLTNYESPFYSVPGVNTVFDPDPNVEDDAYVELLNGIPVLVIADITAPAAMCAGTSFNPAAPTVTDGGSTVLAQGWEIETGVSLNIFTSLIVPYTVAYADNGKKIRYFATNACGTVYSNEVVLSVYPEFNAGAIATTGETICYGDTPSEIGSETDAGGGDGNITYSWRSSADGYDEEIVGAASSTYIPPPGLQSTTTYRRYANDGTCNTTPEVSDGEWTVTVNTELKDFVESLTLTYTETFSGTCLSSEMQISDISGTGKMVELFEEIEDLLDETNIGILSIAGYALTGNLSADMAGVKAALVALMENESPDNSIGALDNKSIDIEVVFEHTTIVNCSPVTVTFTVTFDTTIPEAQQAMLDYIDGLQTNLVENFDYAPACIASGDLIANISGTGTMAGLLAGLPTDVAVVSIAGHVMTGVAAT